MAGQIPPVLYSADFSGCAAIPHLTESTRLKALEAIENLQWLLGARNACIQEIPRGDRPV